MMEIDFKVAHIPNDQGNEVQRYKRREDVLPKRRICTIVSEKAVCPFRTK